MTLPSQNVRRPGDRIGLGPAWFSYRRHNLPELKIHWAGLIVLVCYLLAGMFA